MNDGVRVVGGAMAAAVIVAAGCMGARVTGPVAIVEAPPAASTPPPTKAEPVIETIHGRAVADDYRWLEGDNSDPARMGRITPEVTAWTDAQNDYTRAFLDNLPGRQQIEEEIRPLMEVGSISAPGMYANRYFFSKREGNQNQPVHYWREGYRGESRVLLDPAQIDPSGLTTISWVAPSHDGRLAAYGTYTAGDENTTLHLLEVDSGRKLPVEIPGKVQSVDWLPDGSGFVYRNLSDINNPYSGQVKFHRLGQNPAADPLIFRQYLPSEDQKLATTWGPGASLSHDGRWLAISYWTGTGKNDLWVVDFTRWLQGMSQNDLYGEELTIGEEAVSGGTAIGDTFYMQTTLDAPNGRIVAVDLNHSARKHWKDLVPERKDAVIQGFSIGGGVLAVNYLVNASTTIELFDLAGTPKGKLRLPGIGSAGLSTDHDRTEAYLSFSSYNYPPSIFRVDLANPSAEPELWERPNVPVDPSSVVVKQVWYPSKDGTRISMFIVHPKGITLNGDNPTILYGYGGFRISQTPGFSASMFQWFKHGGIYAIANLRGGGEYGEEWHRAGMLENKQNVFDDFAAAAEYLIRENYTRPERLAIRGGSNGGLLTGTLVTQRPELFAAAIVAVPLLDMVRYQDFLMAKYWVPEYGSAVDEAQFNYIMKYSPYQNIKPGMPYPAVYLTAGENDTRVHPMHARKMAAALRSATSSDPLQKPILLWVDRSAGHGQGKPLNLRIRDVADERMFLMRQLGMLPAAAQ
jgi:prolyl oligopeptidase